MLITNTATAESADSAQLFRLGERMMAELSSSRPYGSGGGEAGGGVGSGTSSASDDDTKDEYNEGPYDPANYMLNGLRNGMSTVHSMARKTLATCKTEKSCEQTASDMESYTRGLLRHEKMFMESSSICTQIIDDIMAEDDQDDQEAQGAGCDGGGGESEDHRGNKPLRPYFPTVEEITRTRAKMNQMYDERMDALKTMLTDDKLKAHPRFVALQGEIKLGTKELKKNLEKQAALDEKLKSVEDDDEATLAILLESCKDRFYIDYGEEAHDEPALTDDYIDPITKRPIRNPARNLQCKHVFEKESIHDFIDKNPDSAKCPVAGCTNESVLKMEHFL